MRKSSAPFLTIVLLASASCGSDARTASVTIDTLPSGALLVRGPAQGVWDSARGWRLEEDLRFGRAEGDGADVFGQVWAITSDAHGRTYVVDRLARVVRVFDDEGGYLRTLGREGRGPGEFVEPFGFAWDPSGRLWVVDVRQARYSVFDTTGVHVSEYRRQVGGFSWPWPGRIDRAGTLYEPSYGGDGTQALVGFELGDDLLPRDTFPRALSGMEPEEFWDLRDENGLGALAAVPFGRGSEWVIDADAHIWTGHSSRYALARRTMTGDTVLVLERDIPAVRVSSEERSAAVDALGDLARHPKMDLTRIPQTKPFFRRLLPGPDGKLWVLREGSGNAWLLDVFDNDGAFLGSIDLPVEPALFPPPRVDRNTILVVTSDSLDVQGIVRYRILRGVE